MPEKKPKKMINIEKLGASRGYRTLFRHLSFCVEAGEIWELRGKNGSGKSTLLRILAGLTRPDEGFVEFAEECHSLHYLGHQDGVKAQETVQQQLEYWARFFEADKDGVRPALERVGLWKRRDVPGRGLSAGQRRRLSLARLLICQRSVWLLDEPFAALDQDGQDLVKTLISEHLMSGGCVIAAMHGGGFEGAKVLAIQAPNSQANSKVQEAVS